MTKYVIPNILPKNAYIDEHDGKIIFNKYVILEKEDEIKIEKGSNLTILPNVKFDVKSIKNYGYIENAGDIYIDTLKNYGKINNVDVIIIGEKIINYKLIENYCFLYLIKANEIVNKSKINNYSYIGGLILYDESIFKGNLVNEFV